MFRNLGKSILNPKKAIRYLAFYFYYLTRKRSGTLLIIGLEANGVFSLMHRGFNKCYCFEPNPERFEQLHRKYSKYQHIKMYNVAASSYNGEVSFNISSNNAASSSIGEFREDWLENKAVTTIRMVKKITVPCLNLYEFCLKNDINFIDDYVSDIQGMDLEVLRTFKPMLDQKKIGSITCEVAKNGRGNIYRDLPDNSEDGFSKLLDTNYALVATGWGVLLSGTFEKVPEEKWEMDCKWIVKE